VLITHDLGAVAGLADRVAVMRAGRVVETGTARYVLTSARDPYTRTLVAEARRAAQPERVPEEGAAAPAAGAAPALELVELGVRYRVAHGPWGARAALAALSDVSLTLTAGEALGVVGESGCGKSTLARAALALVPAAAGQVVWLGCSLTALPPRELRALRRELQIVFQDPLGSLDPRLTVGEIVAEPLLTHAGTGRGAHGAAVAAALGRVGLAPALAQRYPHELSGGQAQRVSIARAMILKPRLLICDEPLSALDAPTQQQVVRLLAELRRESALTLMFVSHNLALVRRLCERVLVLYLGRMMELAPAAALYARPGHPYTRELLAAIPSPDPDVQPARLACVRGGEPPSPLAPPSGCVYRTRCPYAAPVCAAAVPVLEDAAAGHRIACHRFRELP